MPYRRVPVFLLSPGINTRRTTLPPCWIYSMSRGLVSTNQTFFASEKPYFGYSGAEFPRAYVRIHKPVSTGVEKRTDVLWVKWVNESWVIHESMSQWVRSEKIEVSVETIKFFSVFILWSTAIHGMKEKFSFATRDRFSSSNRAQTSTHQMSKNDCSHIWVFER